MGVYIYMRPAAVITHLYPLAIEMPLTLGIDDLLHLKDNTGSNHFSTTCLSMT